MKHLTIVLALALTFFAACNSESTKSNTATSTDSVAATPPQVMEATYAPPAGVDPNVAASVKAIVDGYLLVKNALVSDNSKNAASAGTEMVAAVDKLDMTPMNDAQMKVWHKVMDGIKEHGEFISKNPSDIKKQRGHFEALSKDVEELVRTFGGGQKLYKTFCPMAADNKGATWVSEIEEIRNPYFGSEMMECGEVQEELK